MGHEQKSAKTFDRRLARPSFKTSGFGCTVINFDFAGLYLLWLVDNF